MRIRIMIATLFLATSAYAGSWHATIKKDDFGDQNMGVALTETGGRALGVRCQQGKVPELVFLTIEQWADGLSLLDATLLIRIDDNEPVSKKAYLESYKTVTGFTQVDAVRVVAGGDHLFPLLGLIAIGKRRISVALEIAGQRFENTRFTAAGSNRALKRIWPYCGSKLGDYEKPQL